jgi:hypothetical protein
MVEEHGDAAGRQVRSTGASSNEDMDGLRERSPGRCLAAGVSLWFAIRPSDCHNWIPQGKVRRGTGGHQLRCRPTS